MAKKKTASKQPTSKKTAALADKPTSGSPADKPTSGTTAAKKPAKKPPAKKAAVKRHQYEHAKVELSRCAKCGSTERDPYHHPIEHAIAGVDAAGNEYTHVVWRNTRCRNCGQHRKDRAYENRAG